MSTTTKKNTQQYLDAYMDANPNVKNFVSGKQNTGGAVNNVLPEGASREEQDVAQVYQSAYNNAVAIDKRAQNAVLEANKAHDLSMKYLVAQNEANGLGGLGIADTSALRLSSQYQKALTDAYATREASLLENYQKMTEDASTIRSEWASREEAKAESKYNNALNQLADFTNEASLNAYLDATFGNDTAKKQELAGIWGSSYKDISMADTISAETDANTVTQKLLKSGYTDNGTTLNARGQALLKDWKIANNWTEEKQVVSDKAIEAKSNIRTANGRFVFNDNGSKFNPNAKAGNFSIVDNDGDIYRLETGTRVSDTVIIGAASDVPNKTAFLYKDKVYFKDQNGDIFAIRSRGNDYEGDYKTLKNKLQMN